MSTTLPFDPTGQEIKSDVTGEDLDRGFIAHFEVSAEDAVAASTTGVHAAVTDNGEEQEITTEITNPAVPRNISATAGGTAEDIKAIQVTVEGTNFLDAAISETLPAFTVDTPGTVEGSKAFKTVTKITIPAHDDTEATTAIGWGDKLGLPYKRAVLSCIDAFLDEALEGTAPTVTADVDNIESNTITLSSALDGTKVDAHMVI